VEEWDGVCVWVGWCYEPGARANGSAVLVDGGEECMEVMGGESKGRRRR
jgi:hypothetical protein